MTTAKRKTGPGRRPNRNGRVVSIAVPDELYNVILGLALSGPAQDFSKQALWMWREWLAGRGNPTPLAPVPPGTTP